MERSWLPDPLARTSKSDQTSPVEKPVPVTHHNRQRNHPETPSVSHHKSYRAPKEREPDTSGPQNTRSSSHTRGYVRSPPLNHKDVLLETDLRPQARSPDMDYIPKQETIRLKDGTTPRTITPYENVKMGMLLDDVFTRFCEEELNPGDSIWDLVILTGQQTDRIELDNGLACTVGQYIEQAWPSSKHEIRELFHTLCQGNYEPVRQCQFTRGQYGEADVRSYVLEDGTVKFAFNGASGTIEPLIKALQWLTAVLQPVHKTAVPVASTIRLALESSSKAAKEGGLYRAVVDSATSLKLPRNSSCWTSLFPNTPCAIGFPTQAKPSSMVGIEISFDLMCLLSGVEYEVTEQDGLVLYGRHTMLYPVSRYKDCIQWHLEILGKGGLTPKRRERREMNFRDLEALTDKRSFLGMWEDAAVLLGSASYSNDQLTTLRWSSAAEVVKETHRSGWSFGGSIGLPKSLSLSLTQNFVVAHSRKPQNLVDFEANFDRMVQTPVMLYCPSEKRAWLVSYTSVALHLARVRVAAQSSRLRYNIPACDDNNDGGRAAFNLVQSCHNQPIKVPAAGGTLSRNEKKYTIGHYISEVMSAMDTARRESCLASDALAPFRNKLLGFELADIGHLKPKMKLKQHSLDALASGCWAPLLDEVEYLFFCEGLADPIVPSRLLDYEDTCRRNIWQATPKGYNLLTASLPVLIDLGREYNTQTIDRLTARYDWDSQRVFGSCRRLNRHFCSRLQSVVKKDRGRGPGISVNHRWGAVVFKYAHDISTIKADLSRTQSRNRQVQYLDVPRITTDRHPSNVGATSPKNETGYDSGYDTESLRPGGSARTSGSYGSAGHIGRVSEETVRTGSTHISDSGMSPRPPHIRRVPSSDFRRDRRPNPDIESSETLIRVWKVPKAKERSSLRRLFDFRNVESSFR